MPTAGEVQMGVGTEPGTPMPGKASLHTLDGLSLQLKSDAGVVTPMGWYKVASQTPSGVATVTITAPQTTFRNLRLSISARSTKPATIDQLAIRVNGRTVAGYCLMSQYNGTGYIIPSAQGIVATYWGFDSPGASALAGSFGSYELMFKDYRSASKLPQFVGNYGVLTSTTVFYLEGGAGWSTAAAEAVSNLTVFMVGGNFAAGTTIDLYGEL